MSAEPAAWRVGMSAYRAFRTAFFCAGGLRHLKRKYSAKVVEERMGIFSGSDVPQGGILVHAASVGEVQSANALIRRMRPQTDLPCILSTATETGYDMARRIKGCSADRMIYSPLDAPHFVSSALDALRPAVYISMETERWPEMLYQLKSRGVPAFMVGGRMSEDSLRKLRRMSSFWRGVLSCFTHMLVRFDDDRDNIISLGIPGDAVTVTGDCKVDALFDRRDALDAGKWSELRPADGSPLFIAGSTHRGEEETVLEAFRIVRTKFPNSRLLIVPRHTDRAPMVLTKALKYSEFRSELLSRLNIGVGEWDILVADRLGVLFELYAAADAAFIGGSLVPKGGHNPLEPAIFGIMTAHGPSMTDFPEIERMDSMGAAKCVADSLELADVWLASVQQPNRERISAACRSYCDTLGGACARSWDVIAGSLSPNFLKGGASV